VYNSPLVKTQAAARQLPMAAKRDYGFGFYIK